MTKTNRVPKIEYGVQLPEGVKLSKRPIKNVEISYNEFFPLTQMEVGTTSFVAKGYTARDLRGILHKKSRTRGMKFISRTNKAGTSARVWRIR